MVCRCLTRLFALLLACKLARHLLLLAWDGPLLPACCFLKFWRFIKVVQKSVDVVVSPVGFLGLFMRIGVINRRDVHVRVHELVKHIIVALSFKVFIFFALCLVSRQSVEPQYDIGSLRLRFTLFLDLKLLDCIGVRDRLLRLKDG
jgi:hypothetical protein